MDTASQKVRGSVLPYYGAAAVWVARALAFDLYTVSHFAFTAVLSLGVYLLLRALCGGGAAPAKASETPKAEPKKPEATGNPELDKMLDDGRKAISEMKRLDDAILTQLRDHGKRIRELEDHISTMAETCARERGQQAGSRATLVFIMTVISSLGGCIGAAVGRLF